jgi:hypothetical protein
MCIRLFTFMHEYIIESTVRALKPTVRSVKRAKHILVQFWADKIALVWDLKDVHTAANERGFALTRKEALHVLQAMLQNHNKQYGLHWKDLTSYIEDKCLGRKLTKRELNQFISTNRIIVSRK